MARRFRLVVAAFALTLPLLIVQAQDKPAKDTKTSGDQKSKPAATRDQALWSRGHPRLAPERGRAAPAL